MVISQRKYTGFPVRADILVSAGTELIFSPVAGIVLYFGLKIRITLIL